MVRGALRFGTVFVGFITELVFFPTHLVSFSICVGRTGSKLVLYLNDVEKPALRNYFFLSSPYKACT